MRMPESGRALGRSSRSVSPSIGPDVAIMRSQCLRAGLSSDFASGVVSISSFRGEPVLPLFSERDGAFLRAGSPEGRVELPVPYSESR